MSFLRLNGFPYAERRALAGALDLGDITGIPGFVGEVKDCKTMTLAEWVGELNVEMANAKCDVGSVIHKRRGKTDVGQWYATMPVTVLVRLLREAGYGEAL